MKWNRSLIGLEWERAFSKIFEQTMDGLAPVLIIRTDEPSRVYEMRSYLKSRNDCLYIKLGVTCSMNEIYKIISEQLGCPSNICLERAFYRRIVPVIGDQARQNGAGLTIIIDDCQFFIHSQIFVLIGLVLELTGLVKFIFILSEDYEHQWTKKHPEFERDLFFKLISARYELT